METTATQTIARRPYTTTEGTPERHAEVKARLAEIQAANDAAMDTFLPVMGSTVTPESFSNRVDDRNRYQWTAGTLRHVIAAAAGRRVIITADKQTGFTLVGARLRSLRENPLGGGYQILIEWEYAAGETQSTWYRVESIGFSITAMDAPLHFPAMDLAREESSAAIKAARAALPGCTYGAWKATPEYRSVMVRFAPQKADGGPETAITMELDGNGGFTPGRKYNYRGCSKA